MKYDVSIDKSIFNIYEEIRLGCIRFQVNVEKSLDNFWEYMNNDVLPVVRMKIEDKEWSDIQGIRGSRLAYKAFGRNPGRYRVSSESLLRRVRRGDELYHVNSVVDINNLISITSGMSVGSYDLNCIQGSIIFRKATKGEGYNGIGKDFLDMENMLVLSDDISVFGSSMSDSTRAMVTEKTKDVLVVIYCFENKINLESVLEDAQKAFKKYCLVENIETWIV